MSEELRRKLKEAREKLDFTQKQMAEAIGVPLRTLANWEYNKRTPRNFALRALEEKLDALLKG